MREFCLLLGVAVVVSGCTVHPPGEQIERRAMAQEGARYNAPVEWRHVPALPSNPTADQLVDYALLTNAQLEQRYWEWKSTIEQIPQDGTQNTNLSLFVGASIVNGTMSLDRTTAALGNDPMADVVLPPKLSATATRALENARAAGLRFQKAKYELRRKVLEAAYDLALSSELIRLERQNAQLLETTASLTDARVRAGGAGQQDLLRARNELDLSHNESAAMEARLPAQRAALNALLGRAPDSPVAVADELPAAQPIHESDDVMLAWAGKQNPELLALAHEVRGKQEGVRLARLQYLPDFSFSGGTDLMGITQSLAGSVTIPLLHYEAIDAAVRQAEANVRAVEAMRRQTALDLKAQVVLDLVTLRDADRQIELFGQGILPRARQAVAVTRTAYEAGRASLLELLEAQRSTIALDRLLANLRVEHAKRLSDLEAVCARRLRPAAGV